MVVQPQLLSLSAYIDQNLDKDLPLSSLAKRIGLSPFHFHRKFGAYFGESLHQHIKRLRLERAAFELTYGTKAISEIALASGYKTVSAFSHAFSGFMGQSPTRYRARGTVSASATRTSGEPAELSHAATRPAWIGELAPQRFAFVRAVGHGQGAQLSVRDAIATIADLVMTSQRAEAVGLPQGANAVGQAIEDDRSIGAARPNGLLRSIEFIAATTDFYGIVNAGDFRVDVGLDADRVPSGREEALGMRTLAGGRYARFDIACAPDELIGRCYRAAMHGLRGLPDGARTSSHFVRFAPSAWGSDRGSDNDPDGGPKTYRFFIPLTG